MGFLKNGQIFKKWDASYLVGGVCIFLVFFMILVAHGNICDHGISQKNLWNLRLKKFSSGLRPENQFKRLAARGPVSFRGGGSRLLPPPLYKPRGLFFFRPGFSKPRLITWSFSTEAYFPMPPPLPTDQKLPVWKGPKPINCGVFKKRHMLLGHKSK